MCCNLKASNETVMMEIFQGLDIIYLAVNVQAIFFSVKEKLSFCSFDTQIFKFGHLSLELHDVRIFRRVSDTSRTLSLYSAHPCLKLEGSALEMYLLWFRTSLCCWNVAVDGSLMLDNPFSVSFLCILEYISLYFTQNSMQVTSNWMTPFSANHIMLK